MQLFNVQNATGTINKQVEAEGHDEAIIKAAGNLANDRRFCWKTKSLGNVRKDGALVAQI